MPLGKKKTLFLYITIERIEDAALCQWENTNFAIHLEGIILFAYKWDHIDINLKFGVQIALLIYLHLWFHW